MTDPRGLRTTYVLDGLGNKRSNVSPDTGTSNMTHDAAGNVTSVTDARGKTATMTYDSLSRLTQLSWPTGTPITFQYDGGTTPVAPNIGKLTRITDESGSTSFAYNAFGRIVTKTQVTNAKTLTNSYAYGTSGNAMGQLTSFTYPSGMRVNYGYDSQGRVNSISINPLNTNGAGTNTAMSIAVLSGLTYSALGDIAGWAWGDATPYSLTYDQYGRLALTPWPKSR